VMLSEVTRATVEPATPRRARDYTGVRMKVLLIDDDHAHIDIIHSLLKGLHFDVLVANNGCAGLQLAGEHVPDLAMVDISMPDLNGWEVVRHLRQSERLRQLKIIMVSANAHEYKAGGKEDELHDAFVMKPVDVQLLLERVGELLSLKWIYEPTVPVVSQPVGVLPSSSRHHIDDLYQLGRIGHVRGIQAKLHEIESEDPSNKPFAVHMRGLVASFDLKRYMTVLEAMRKNA
ncbi:MAG: response regulator, partial [Steroidobacteraceae bacterium]